jgi:hypothetical protein
MGNYRPKEGKENGNHIYQMMLNSMQVLPVTNICHIAAFDNENTVLGSKDKRKATEDAGSHTHVKKKAKDGTRTGKVPSRRKTWAGPSTTDDVTMENI